MTGSTLSEEAMGVLPFTCVQLSLSEFLQKSSACTFSQKPTRKSHVGQMRLKASTTVNNQVLNSDQIFQLKY